MELRHTYAPAKLCILPSLLVLLLGSFAQPANGDVPVFSQPQNPAGGQYKSAWYAPDGLDSDENVWDAFTLPSNTAITQIQWRGAYTNYLSGAGQAPVYNFTIAIYSSIAAGSQPDIVNGRLVRYYAGNNAGETPAGTFGGVAMYDYHFTLPSPFQAAAGTKYWLQIIAWQGVTPTYYWPPDWSWSRGTGGEGSHFRRVGGTGGSYTSITGDCVFTLLASSAPSSTISATAQPLAAGVITGAGAYPNGSVATLIATANHGYGFVNWTESGAPVSTNSSYSFTVATNRTLVANFIAAYSVATNSMPTYGGTTSGDGVYNADATATVVATAKHGFVFEQWTEFGTPVSTSATYSFTPTADITLTAQFAHAPGATTFDFDNAPVHTSLPVSLASGGLGVTCSATGSGFSIQAVGEVGIAPAGFSGLCIYPNSVFPADLVFDFSAPLVDLALLYSPQELGCDDSARMRVTALLDGVQVGTATTTAPAPGSWPTGTLSISVPTGFNRAVIHYDAHPPTCQDWGPIFLADNLTVTMLCSAAMVTADPISTVVCPLGVATFDVVAAGTGVLVYAWDADSGAGWISLTDGPLPGIGTILGAATPTLQISAPETSGLLVRCVASNDCGTAISTAAALTLTLPADLNCDSVVNNFDIDPFVLALLDPAGYAAAYPTCEILNGDTNCDGLFNNFDIDPFVALILGPP